MFTEVSFVYAWTPEKKCQESLAQHGATEGKLDFNYHFLTLRFVCIRFISCHNIKHIPISILVGGPDSTRYLASCLLRVIMPTVTWPWSWWGLGQIPPWPARLPLPESRGITRNSLEPSSVLTQQVIMVSVHIHYYRLTKPLSKTHTHMQRGTI